MEEYYDVEEAKAAQFKYCQDNRLPHFAPSSGICWGCGRNIYELSICGNFETGISVEEAGSKLISGCPHCYRSYCD